MTATKIRAAVLGVDVSKSRSPAIHNAAFRALGVDGEYGAVSVAAPDFDARVADLQAQGYRYLNVTIPHKAAAFALAGAHGPEARVSGAVNTLLFEPGGGIRGENTDGAGLLAALADLGAPAAGSVVVMAGAGGAAAGAVEALTRSGAQVRLVARRPEIAAELRARLLPAQRHRVTVTPWTGDGLARALAGATVLVSAVPAAAWAEASTAVGIETLPAGGAILEMAYGGDTPLSVAARARGARYADGLGMLVHQAAHAIALALGKQPPLAPLFEAVRAS
ncbi:MAG TPA: shikimate dehydrogenase [Polyangia bacterium]|jgi:shikimate dehydrogenase|nr:shikimate dehydrogenase [Polyangia bacterium]